MAATGGAKAGIDGAAYRNTGTYGSPTWVEVDSVRNMNPAYPWDMNDASARATNVKLYRKTQTDWSLSFDIRCDDLDTAYQAIYANAFTPNTLLDMMFLNGPISVEGSRGVRFHANLSISAEDQTIGGVQYDTIDAKPGFHTDGVPKTVVAGAASALTYTAA